jgi:hypothetical protein
MNLNQSEQANSAKLAPWLPQQTLKSYDSDQVRFSGGFLRSRPERWFPGFSAHWLPLAHALGIEVQLVEIKPLLIIPPALEFMYSVGIGDQSIAVGVDAESAKIIAEAIAPGSRDDAARVVIEYVMRRFISTAAMAWSGEEASSVQFFAQREPVTTELVGSIKLTVMVNNYYCTIWTMLTQGLVARLDGLWKRQANAQARSDLSSGTVQVEVSQLGVDPTRIDEYVSAGAIIDLEVSISDQVLLRMDGKPWILSRLGLVNDAFAFESLSAPISDLQMAAGLTSISVQLGEVSLAPESVTELSQPGTIVQSALAAGNRVKLFVQKNLVAQGTLCTFDERWAVLVDGPA